jgi:hypothetical protein
VCLGEIGETLERLMEQPTGKRLVKIVNFVRCRGRRKDDLRGQNFAERTCLRDANRAGTVKFPGAFWLFDR